MTRQPVVTRRQLLRVTGLAVGGGFVAQRLSTSRYAAPAFAQTASTRPLRVALPGEPSFMNPILVASDRNFAKVSWNVFDSLLGYDYGARRSTPQLATSWRQVDPTTWEFKLREGVQFHRGYGELTAADVEFMVNYVVDNNKPLKFLYFFVKGAKATGKYTVQYSLSQPFAPFLLTTVRDRGAMIVSKKAYQEMGEEAFSRTPVGTGPFELSSWQEGTEIVLKRFAQYWQNPLPHLDEVSYRFITDTVTRESLLKTGEIDFMDNPDYKDVERWRRDPGFAVTSVPSWGTDYMPFSVTTPPFDKKALRQAVAFAVDRASLAKSFFFGEAEADPGPLPRGYLGYPSPAIYPLGANTAKAKELLSEAGVPNGFQTTALTTAQFKPLAEVISGQLADVGIQMSVEVVDPGTFNARTSSKKFEVAVVNLAFMTPDTDSTAYWFYHTDTVGNYGYDNPTIDKALEDARATYDQQKRAAMYRSILTTVLPDAPFVYLLHPNIIHIYRKGLQGVPGYPQEYAIDLRNATWT